MVEEETEDRDWPELLSDTSVVGGAGHGAGMPRLKRGQGSRHLGVDMAFNPDDEEGAEQRNKYFTSSGNWSKQAAVLNQMFSEQKWDICENTEFSFLKKAINGQQIVRSCMQCLIMAWAKFDESRFSLDECCGIKCTAISAENLKKDKQ